MKKMLKNYFIFFSLTCIFTLENANAQPTQSYTNSIGLTTTFSLPKNIYYNANNDEDTIAIYFKNFEVLSKLERWEEIIEQGSLALESTKKLKRYSDEAKICAQLTSTSFYKGNYNQALIYATRCHELAENFEDSSLFIRALYLESAIYRALAAKETTEESQQSFYARAVDICEEAATLYAQMHVENINLKGKVYFNLGAAHADNPNGNLEKADSCYIIANECFEYAADDMIRTTMRRGKIYFLQKQYELCQQMINVARPLISSERLAMHADYLEAQLRFAMQNFEEAYQITKSGLEKAKLLGAQEDESRLYSLLKKIEESINF